MLPLILLVLVKGISAVEFSGLAPHINVIWNNVNISSQINADHTASVKGEVPVFTLCGPYNSKESSVRCVVEAEILEKISLYTNGELIEYTRSSLNKTLSIAGKISLEDSGASCWHFQNPIPEFVEFYKSDLFALDWKVQYKCPSSSSDSSEFPSLGSRISLIWDNVNISSQINTDQTHSVKGEVPIYTICGIGNSRASRANCEMKYLRDVTPFRWNEVHNAKWELFIEKVLVIAGKVSQSGSGDSCWQFNNPNSWRNAYYYEASDIRWKLEFICTTLALDEPSTTISDSDTNTTINGGSNILILGGFICFAMVVGVLIGFKLGRNTKTKGLNNSPITVELRSKV